MQVYPNEGTQKIADTVKTLLASSKLRLFTTAVTAVGSGTTKAELEAAECDFTGYTEGGVTITAFLAPLLNPVGGSSIDWPTVQFAAASPYTVGNVVGGWWIETAAGVLIACGTFGGGGIPVGAAGQGFPLSGSLVFPSGG
jgi:hypothetical protein